MSGYQNVIPRIILNIFSQKVSTLPIFSEQLNLFELKPNTLSVLSDIQKWYVWIEEAVVESADLTGVAH